MGAFTPGQGWFKNLQQFAADSHFKLYHVGQWLWDRYMA